MADLSILNEIIGARVPIISVETYEELRAIRLIRDMTTGGDYPFQKDKKVFLWDAVDGLSEMTDAGLTVVPGMTDPMVMLDHIKTYEPAQVRKGQAWGALFILRDIHPYMDAALIRGLRNLANAIRPTRKTVLLVSPGFDIPAELHHDCDVFQFPLPDKAELVGLVAQSAKQAPKSIKVDLDESALTAVSDALAGMTEEAGRGAIGRSMVRTRQFSREVIPHILEQKAAHIRGSGLEFINEKV